MEQKEPDPLAGFWKTSGRVAVIAAPVIAGVRAALMDTGYGNLAEFVLGVLIGLAAIVIALLLTRLGARFFRALPAGALTTFAAVALALYFISEYSPAEVLRTVLEPDDWTWPLQLPHGFSVAAVFALVMTCSLIAGIVVLQRGGLGGLAARRRITLTIVTLSFATISISAILSLASDGKDPFPTDYRTLDNPLPALAGDPSQAGPHSVVRLSYGAGQNARRPDFGEQRDLESRTVDATAMLPEWKGIKKRMRESFWGFGLDEAPLNGLVWAPDGAGPFPLVLIVHGNHGMEDYSDPGYAYLGELLASRGFIAVSVDENYINGSWSGDFRGKEMPIRAWLLLEHLSLWRDWNASPGHRFAGRVDLDNVALVGHSRGGEAVPIAHLFNDLPHYPDDATVEFNYGFNIRSLVAIAQVDQRYHRRVEIDNVNFLALQGSYDSDEPAFHGLRQFNRIQLDDDRYRFKAGIYVHGANHGQFNSTWGREDTSPPSSWLLNLAPIIPAGDQRQVAKVYIAAFLEATLHDDPRYLPLFRDPRSGADWLPDHAYVNQFMDSTFVPIATFDDDLNVTTATAPGATIAARNFALWREEALKHRDERLQGTSAVVLGWQDRANAEYAIDLPASFWTGAAQGAELLTLSVSASTEKPPANDDETDKSVDADQKDEDAAPAPRFTIEAEDTAGRVRAVDSEDIVALAPPLRVQYLKSKRLNTAGYKSEWEAVLQHVEVPLAALSTIDDSGRPTAIRTLRFRFADAPAGVVIFDDIGVRRAITPTNGD